MYVERGSEHKNSKGFEEGNWGVEGDLDWRKEIIAYLEQRVRYYRKLMVVERVNEILEHQPILSEGAAVRVVREDRDSYWCFEFS
jgi:hypothetical protein